MTAGEKLPQTRKSRDVLKIAAAGLVCFITGAALADLADGNSAQSARTTDAAAIKEAKAQYAEEFKQASPSEKYSMDFLSRKSISIPPYSVNNSPNTVYTFVNFNNGCLEHTAYDTSSSNGSNTPVPEINPLNHNQLIIASVGSNATLLLFNGLIHGDVLTPANEYTSNALSSNGCKTGFTGISHQ